MDIDDDMSGLQIEDLGEYFLQTDIDDSWKGFALTYTDEVHQQDLNLVAGIHVSEDLRGPAISSAQHLTSPPLSSISELLEHDNGQEMRLSFGSPLEDVVNFYPTGVTPVCANSETAMINRSIKDTSELGNFSLNHLHKSLVIVGSTPTAQVGGSAKLAAPVMSNPRCQNILASTNDSMKKADHAFYRDSNIMAASCEPSGCSAIGSTSTFSASDDGRGFRKKSREKMRRHEVNIKFEELIDLLGLSNRERKSAILQKAVSTIKSLRRERDELHYNRDRLQQEVSKLVMCLQHLHLGSVAAVTTQPDQQLLNSNTSVRNQGTKLSNGLQPVHMHPLDVPRTNCFPLRSVFSSTSSQLESLLSSKSGQVAIAPKLYNTSASDTEKA